MLYFMMQFQQCLNYVEIESMSPPLAAINQAFSKTIDNGKMNDSGGMLLKSVWVHWNHIN